MSVKPITEKVFKEFTDYKTPKQAITQMNYFAGYSKVRIPPQQARATMTCQGRFPVRHQDMVPMVLTP